MPIAIVLRATPGSAEALRPLVEAAAAFEERPSMAALGYPPHVTLGVYERAHGLAEAAAALFAARASVALDIRRLAWFDADPLILYAAPEPSPSLAALHERLHALVPPERSHEHYRPGRFVPHCTLVSNIGGGRRAAAIAFATATRPPPRLVLDRGELVAFPPARVLASWPLTGQARR